MLQPSRSDLKSGSESCNFKFTECFFQQLLLTGNLRADSSLDDGLAAGLTGEEKLTLRKGSLRALTAAAERLSGRSGLNGGIIIPRKESMESQGIRRLDVENFVLIVAQGAGGAQPPKKLQGRFGHILEAGGEFKTPYLFISSVD
jgi:hypothetical protein